MIKVDKNTIKIEGDLPLILSEFSILVRGLNEDCDIKEKMLRENFEMGFMSKEEIEKKTLDSLKKMANKLDNIIKKIK